MMYHDWNTGADVAVRTCHADRNTAAIAAQRLGAHVEMPDVLRDRLIRDEWIKRVADAKWFGFFMGATVSGFVWLAGYLILEGWK